MNEVRADGDALDLPEGAVATLDRVLDQANAILCAESTGCASEMIKATISYLKTRKQFGAELATFQALRHRVADLVVQLEQCRSMTFYACGMSESGDTRARRTAVSAARSLVSRNAIHIAKDTIQLHGGIGMTMEYHVGHHFKRLAMIDALFGNGDRHLHVVRENGGVFAAEFA